MYVVRFALIMVYRKNQPLNVTCKVAVHVESYFMICHTEKSYV
jgi:hypothetical protein